MPYTISKDGWVSGTITGPGGVEYPVEKHECPRPNNEPYRRLEKHPPDLLLHTTEGTDLDSAIATLKAKFSPSQFACGENRIAQLRPLWAQGAAVDTMSAYYMQVENVAKSQTTLWLPAPATLNPLVALTAMLHREHIITTGLKRPPGLASLPLVLDRLPAAVDTYYRRSLAPEPAQDGVRGHVDSKDDEHWDPGSFDYATFFKMVAPLVAPKPPPARLGVIVRTAEGKFSTRMSIWRATRLVRKELLASRDKVKAGNGPAVVMASLRLYEPGDSGGH